MEKQAREIFANELIPDFKLVLESKYNGNKNNNEFQTNVRESSLKRLDSIIPALLIDKLVDEYLEN